MSWNRVLSSEKSESWDSVIVGSTVMSPGMMTQKSVFLMHASYAKNCSFSACLQSNKLTSSVFQLNEDHSAVRYVPGMVWVVDQRFYGALVDPFTGVSRTVQISAVQIHASVAPLLIDVGRLGVEREAGGAVGRVPVAAVCSLELRTAGTQVRVTLNSVVLAHPDLREIDARVARVEGTHESDMGCWLGECSHHQVGED